MYLLYGALSKKIISQIYAHRVSKSTRSNICHYHSKMLSTCRVESETRELIVTYRQNSRVTLWLLSRI